MFVFGREWTDLNSFIWGLKPSRVKRLKSEERWRKWEDTCLSKRKNISLDKKDTLPSYEEKVKTVCVCALALGCVCALGCVQKLEESLPAMFQCPLFQGKRARRHLSPILSQPGRATCSRLPGSDAHLGL